MAKEFKYELGQKLAITASGEVGEVIGRAEYATSEDDYRLHYKSADGRAVCEWWGEKFLDLA